MGSEVSCKNPFLRPTWSVAPERIVGKEVSLRWYHTEGCQLCEWVWSLPLDSRRSALLQARLASCCGGAEGVGAGPVGSSPGFCRGGLGRGGRAQREGRQELPGGNTGAACASAAFHTLKLLPQLKKKRKKKKKKEKI